MEDNLFPACGDNNDKFHIIINQYELETKIFNKKHKQLKEEKIERILKKKL